MELSSLFREPRQILFQFISKNILVMYGTGIVIRWSWLGGKKSKSCRVKRYTLYDKKFQNKFFEEIEMGVLPPLSRVELIEDIEIIREIQRGWRKRYHYWLNQEDKNH